MDKRFPIEDQIDMLAASLKGRVIGPRHAEYDAARQVALANFDPLPAAVIRVGNAADVAAVINFARATDLALSVRSGGHSTVGHSGNDGGLVIDLRDLNSIAIDAATETAWCGTGTTAGQVTDAVQMHGFIVGFGDAATVGIGGLTLGGGMGYLLRKHGLTIDSLLAAEVVTAGSDIVIADESNHPDLFWALRGGGGNFGVVTRLKYRLHRLPAFTGGPLILPANPDVVAAFAKAAEAAPDELSTIAMLMTAPPIPFLPPEAHGELIFMCMMAYAGPAEDAQRALAPFRALATPIADLVGEAPFSSMYIPEDPNMRAAVSMSTMFADEVTSADAAKLIELLNAHDAPVRAAQVRVLGGAAARVPTGATAFAHRNAKIMMSFMAMDFAPGADQRSAEWISRCRVTMDYRASGGAYVNFLGTGDSNGVWAAYPPETLRRLRQVKCQYDPENLFRLNQNILPA